jgi:hypothetical protein
MSKDNFSLMRGGAVHRFLSWSGALRPRLSLSKLIAFLIVAIAFLPLAASASLDGTLWGYGKRVDIPLMVDYGLLFRLLGALPLLILAAPLSDQLLRSAIRQFSRGGFVRKDEQGKFQHILDRAERLRDAWLPEVLALLFAFAPLSSSPHMPELGHLSSWAGDGRGATSWAGDWFNHVSAPLFRFVAMLWFWRFLLWVWMLWRFSRLQLDLRAPHPDGAGGLGFLGTAQVRFSSLAVAGSLLVCGACINHLLYTGASIKSLQLLLGGYVVGASALLLAPLLLMAPPLIRAKRHALSKYGILGHRAVSQFEQRWKRGAPADNSSLIDSGTPSALADFSAVYGTVAGMSVMPVSRSNLISMLLAAAVPLAPLVFFVMSLDELASKLVSILV